MHTKPRPFLTLFTVDHCKVVQAIQWQTAHLACAGAMLISQLLVDMGVLPYTAVLKTLHTVTR